jgi:hypothetical protein
VIGTHDVLPSPCQFEGVMLATMAGREYVSLKLYRSGSGLRLDLGICALTKPYNAETVDE